MQRLIQSLDLKNEELKVLIFDEIKIICKEIDQNYWEISYGTESFQIILKEALRRQKEKGNITKRMLLELEPEDRKILGII